jgi:isopentenyldiphosphate isomerase
MDEILDIVNEHDQVIGQKSRSEVYAQNMTNFRVINGFVINNEKQLWIPRRTAHKRLMPLHLDCSVGGHVEAGETYQMAFERELKEELNLDAATLDYQMIGSMNPHDDAVTAFMQVYLLKYNTAPLYNPNDFIEYYWMSADELLNKIAQGVKAKSDIPLIINKFYEIINKN